MRLLAAFLSLMLVGCALPRPANTDLQTKDIQDVSLISRDKEITILALSGGGPNGTWSVGFLQGWKLKPKFDIVTGVSAGSIVASHAFINEADDKNLNDTMINLKESDYLDIRPLSLIVFNNSASSNDHLKNLVAKVVTNEVIDRVAVEGKSGRKFYVATADLDYGKLRTWDMTEIAQQKQYDKYRSIIMASASIPIVFPPVFIDGSMNVDGATFKLVFVPEISPPDVHKQIYVIRNGAGGPTPKQEVTNSIKAIGMRTAALMIDANSNKSIQEIMETKNASIYYSEIDQDIPVLGFTSFTPDQIRKIYERALERGKQEKWAKIVDNK